MARRRKAAVAETGPVEGPWELPDSWSWARLGSHADLVRGVSYSKGQASPLAASGHVPLLRGNNIQGGSLALTDLLYVQTSCVSDAQYLHAGDIVLTMSSGSAALVGKSALIQAVPGPMTFGAFCGCIRAIEGLDPRWAHWFLQTDFYREQISASAKGTNINNLKREHVLSLPIPVPPLETQRRIVARIDELFSELDDGEAALARARADLETYRKSLLKAAVTGKLTADWRAANPPSESGEQLLQRILADRKARWEADPKNRGKRYKAKAMDEIAPDHQRRMWQLPESWQWLQIGEFAFVTKLAGFEYTKYVRYADDGDLSVIKAENAGPLGWRKTNFSRVHSASVEQLTRSKLRTGDLLIVFVGAGTGNVATVPEGDFFLGPNIGMIRIETDHVIPLYLEHYLRSPQGKDMALALSKAVAQPSLSMGTIRQIPVPIPSINEQKLIVARLQEDLLAAEEAVAHASHQTDRAKSLKQSILAAAFRGELVQ